MKYWKKEDQIWGEVKKRKMEDRKMEDRIWGEVRTRKMEDRKMEDQKMEDRNMQDQLLEWKMQDQIITQSRTCTTTRNC